MVVIGLRGRIKNKLVMKKVNKIIYFSLFTKYAAKLAKDYRILAG